MKANSYRVNQGVKWNLNPVFCRVIHLSNPDNPSLNHNQRSFKSSKGLENINIPQFKQLQVRSRRRNRIKSITFDLTHNIPSSLRFNHMLLLPTLKFSLRSWKDKSRNILLPQERKAARSKNGRQS